MPVSDFQTLIKSCSIEPEMIQVQFKDLLYRNARNVRFMLFRKNSNELFLIFYAFAPAFARCEHTLTLEYHQGFFFGFYPVVEVDCGDPSFVENAHPRNSAGPFPYGATVYYDCYRGYTGGRTLVCQRDGQ